MRLNGGLSRGKGSAVGSGLDFHFCWKVEGRESVSMVAGGDIVEIGVDVRGLDVDEEMVKG